MRKGRATQLKRQRERMLQDRRKEKAQRRQESKARRADLPAREPGEDPDIAGIRPGPQPSPFDQMLGLDDDQSN
jgi:hypothetical protein